MPVVRHMLVIFSTSGDCPVYPHPSSCGIFSVQVLFVFRYLLVIFYAGRFVRCILDARVWCLCCASLHRAFSIACGDPRLFILVWALESLSQGIIFRPPGGH